MRFRPCIDIHNGVVKQIIGGSLRDEGNNATTNFVSEKDSVYFANLYKEKGLRGGHIIMLNSRDSEYYERTKEEALKALAATPGLLQIGGGITTDNAKDFLDAGASHIIVTTYIFENGLVSLEKLEKLKKLVGKDKIVLDLSCRRKGDKYYVVTDRWQTFTRTTLNVDTLKKLSNYCDEFLIHGVDVEGKAMGMEEELVNIITDYMEDADEFPSIDKFKKTIDLNTYIENKDDWIGRDSIMVRKDHSKITYAGGMHTYENIERFAKVSKGIIDYTIGSALDIFGGNLNFDRICENKLRGIRYIEK